MNDDAELIRSPEERNFRWCYRALVALAKIELEETNACRESPGEWPAGQSWNELAGSSKSVFIRAARERCGIDHREFLDVLRSNCYEVYDLFGDDA